MKRGKKKTRLRLLPTSFLETFAAKSVIRCPALLQGSINSRHEVGNSLSSFSLRFLRYHLCISGRYGRRRNGQIQRIQGTQHCQLVAREKTKDYLLEMKFASLIAETEQEKVQRPVGESPFQTLEEEEGCHPAA